MSKARVYLRAESSGAVRISSVFGSTLDGKDEIFGDRFNSVPLTELQWAGNFTFHALGASMPQFEMPFDLSNLKRLFLEDLHSNYFTNTFPRVPSLDQIVCPKYFRTSKGDFLSLLPEGSTMYAPPAMLAHYPGKPEGFPGKTVGYEYPGVL
jgi:hypothetical protein